MQMLAAEGNGKEVVRSGRLSWYVHAVMVWL